MPSRVYGIDTNPVVQTMAEKAVRRLGSSLPRLVQDPRDLGARTDALYGAWIAAYFRAAVGLEHAIAQRVRQWFNLDHAHTHAVATPYAAGFNASAAPEAMARIRRALWRRGCCARPLRIKRSARTAHGVKRSRPPREGSRQSRRSRFGGQDRASKSCHQGRSGERHRSGFCGRTVALLSRARANVGSPHYPRYSRSRENPRRETRQRQNRDRRLGNEVGGALHSSP